jgi:dienelactone hydrolase
MRDAGGVFAAMMGLAIIVAGVTGCATAPPPTALAEGQSGTIVLPTMTLTTGQFLTGAKDGTPAVISGELRLPREGTGRLPAVILVHGSGGAGPREQKWAREFTYMRVAAFILDSFTRRGITETATDQSRLASAAMIVDAYRALGLLATHPRIDPSRVALMGFSKGGFVALYASLSRFHRMHGPAGIEFAAHLPFYPPCLATFIDDEQVSDRPIRIFHGTADDYTPIEPCRQYVERLRRAGKDVQLIEYAGAHHGFDHAAPRYLPQVQSGRRCSLEERPGGIIVNRDTGQRFSFNDPCISRGATVGYDPRAYEEALKAVKAFLTATFKLGG